MDTIPEDVWPLMVKFMDDRSKRWLRLANTKWFNIIRYNDFKIYFARTENIGAITDRLSKYSWPIKISFIKSKIDDALELINNLPKLTNMISLSADDYMDVLNFRPITRDQWMQLSTLTNLNSWSIDPARGCLPDQLWYKFTKLTELTALDNFSEDKAKDILQHMTDLQSFAYSPTKLPDSGVNTWPYALLPNPGRLEKFSMLAQTKQTDGTEVFPHLTNLKNLRIFDQGKNNIDLSYFTALEDLFLYSYEFPSFASNANLTNLKIHLWNSKNSDSIGKLTNLRYLSIDLPQLQEEPIQSLSVLADLHQLTSFYLLRSPFIPNHLDLVPKSSFKYLPPSLKAFKTNVEVDLADITHLMNLEALELEKPSLNIGNILMFSNLTKLHITQGRNDIEQSWRFVEKLPYLEAVTLTVGLNNDSKLLEDLPDISHLTNITSLRWGLNGCPKNCLDQIKSLTGLKELTMIPNEKGNRDPPIESAEFLGELTNLVKLEISVDATDGSLWQNLLKLTKLEYLDIFSIDDDKLLMLTALANLTHLTIQDAVEDFDGRHFTALTTLQIINFVHGDESPLLYTEDIKERMPYLLQCSFYLGNN